MLSFFYGHIEFQVGLYPYGINQEGGCPSAGVQSQPTIFRYSRPPWASTDVTLARLEYLLFLSNKMILAPTISMVDTNNGWIRHLGEQGDNLVSIFKPTPPGQGHARTEAGRIFPMQYYRGVDTEILDQFPYGPQNAVVSCHKSDSRKTHY